MNLLKINIVPLVVLYLTVGSFFTFRWYVFLLCYFYLILKKKMPLSNIAILTVLGFALEGLVSKII